VKLKASNISFLVIIFHLSTIFGIITPISELLGISVISFSLKVPTSTSYKKSVVPAGRNLIFNSLSYNLYFTLFDLFSPVPSHIIKD